MAVIQGMDMKKVLAPSMLAADFARLGEQLNTIENAGASVLHVDVMDGTFVPSISFGMPVVKSIRKATGLFFDVHMMVQDPERYIDELVDCGADCITIHLEACKNPAAALHRIAVLGCKPSLSLNPKTPLEAIREYLPLCEQVLVMSVEPGFGGQKYIPSSDEKLRELVKLREELGLDFAIEVDGGVTMDNVAHIVECGADVIVAGSAVFKNDIAQNVKEFNAVLSRYDG